MQQQRSKAAEMHFRMKLVMVVIVKTFDLEKKLVISP
jgi:hypothetical protein